MNNEVLEQLKQEYNETLNRMQDLGDILAHCAEMDTSHCGQDAEDHQPVGYTYKDLLGMEVMFVFPHRHKCGYCTFRKGADGSECPCVKVELVGGDYICLEKPQQEDAKPVISFDEEDTGKESLLDIMAEIKEKADNFMDYLDKVVINPQEQ